MPRANPLDPAWRAYLAGKDALLIAQRAISHGQRRFLRNTVFASSSAAASRRAIESGRGRLDDLAVVALWAEFERFLLDHLRRKARAFARTRPRPFARRLHEKVDREIEYWKIDDVLDLYKSVVDPDRIGQAKQVKDFRDWIAHRNPRKGSPPKIVPKLTYNLLSGIIAEVKRRAT